MSGWGWGCVGGVGGVCGGGQSEQESVSDISIDAHRQLGNSRYGTVGTAVNWQAGRRAGGRGVCWSAACDAVC